MKNLRNLRCKVLGHEMFDAETLRTQPWMWGEFRGFGAEAFAHKNCLRCNAPVSSEEARSAGERRAA
jgi:hypothetical protein